MDGKHTALLLAKQPPQVFWHTLSVSRLSPVESDAIKVAREVSEVSSLGTEPLINGKLWRLTYVSLVRFPKYCGNGPENWL